VAQITGIEVVKTIKAEFKLPELPRSRLFSWLKTRSTFSDDILPEVRESAPLGRDVVAWMQEVASWRAALDIYAQSVESAGGEIDFAADDGYIPGCATPRVRYESIPNSELVSRGYATVIAPNATFNVPVDSKSTLATCDFLGWAANRRGEWIQWNGALVDFRRLPETPVTESIPHVNLSGFAAPNFIKVYPPFTLRMVHADYITLSSDRPQSLTIKLRSPSCYKNVYGSGSVQIPAGTSTIKLRVRGAGAYVTEIQPQDGTKTVLESYVVRRW